MTRRRKPQNRGRSGARPKRRGKRNLSAEIAQARARVDAELAQAAMQRTPEGKFVKGVSGNPGGRPKSLRSIVAELSKDGEGGELIEFFFEVMRGELKVEKVTMLGIPYLAAPGHKDRREAAEWLGDQFFGKARQRIEHTGKDGGPIQTDDANGRLLEHCTDEELEQLEEVARRAAARAASKPAEGGDAGDAAQP